MKNENQKEKLFKLAKKAFIFGYEGALEAFIEIARKEERENFTKEEVIQIAQDGLRALELFAMFETGGHSALEEILKNLNINLSDDE